MALLHRSNGQPYNIQFGILAIGNGYYYEFNKDQQQTQGPSSSLYKFEDESYRGWIYGITFHMMPAHINLIENIRPVGQASFYPPGQQKKKKN
jgi:hypothetical protein